MCRALKRIDLRKMQSYMLQKSLSDSRMEFLWQTNMLDSRSTMKGKYNKDQYWCPTCIEGRSIRAIESPAHFMVCSAYLDLRVGIDSELVEADRAPYLRKVVLRRKELEE